jgi:hypothetical protein
LHLPKNDTIAENHLCSNGDETEKCLGQFSCVCFDGTLCQKNHSRFRLRARLDVDIEGVGIELGSIPKQA